MDRADETWHDGAEIPAIESGREWQFIVAVQRAKSGKVYSFAASYLNAYPLRYEYGCPKERDGCKGDNEACADGCPTTGWYDVTGDDGDDAQYQKLSLAEGDKLMGWRHVPQWPA